MPKFVKIRAGDGEIDFEKERLVKISDYCRVFLDGNFRENGLSEINFEDYFTLEIETVLFDKELSVEKLEDVLKFSDHFGQGFFLNEIL